MKPSPYPVSHELANDAVPRPLRHFLNCMPDVTHMMAHRRLRNAGGQRVLGHLEQLLRLGTDATDRQGRGGIGMQSFEVHPHIHADDAALIEHASGRRDPVDDFRINRGTERLGKAVETLEGGRRTVVTADEFFGGAVEIFRGEAGPNRLTHQGERCRDDLPRPGHDFNFPGRLQRDHCYRPSDCCTRSAISWTVPTAGILRTPFRAWYQERTGAV